MSGIYPYCLLPSGVHPPNGLGGLGGRPVRGYAVQSFTVWASHLEQVPETSLAEVSLHHEVVRLASATHTPLPVRFGAWARDLETLATRILHREEELRRALESVHGRAEFGVTIGDAPAEVVPAPPADSDARTYLRELSRVHESRRRRRHLRRRLVATLRDALADVSVAEHVQALHAPRLVSVAHLVAKSDEPRFRQTVSRFEQNLSENATVHVTGPWPPYSFSPS